MKNEPERAIGYLIEALEISRKRVGPDHPGVASGNQVVGSVFIRLGKFAEAEPYLRESWRIYLQTAPDSAYTFWTEILLGVSLLGQKKFAEAEPRLLSGYQGLKGTDGTVSPERKSPTNQVLDRIIQLYDRFGRKDKADEWRKVQLSMNSKAQAKP